MDEEKLTRCFIALDLSRESINEIKKIQERIIKKDFFMGRFTEPENLHLTLKFLGEINDEKIEEIKKKLSEVKLDSFETYLGEIGIFSKKIARIIWIKLNGSQNLRNFGTSKTKSFERKGIFDLQRQIDEKLKDLFNPEERFMSHITIARVKHVKNKQKLIDYMENIKIKKVKFRVDKFFLKKSELNPEGPVYQDIEEYKLCS